MQRIAGALYQEVFSLHHVTADRRPDIGEIVRQVHALTRAVPVRVVVFGATDLSLSGAEDLACLLVGDQHPPRERNIGIEVHGIVPNPASNVRIKRIGPSATLLDTPGENGSVRRLFATVARPAGDTLAEQATAIFGAVESTLTAAGMVPGHITRTWYFIGDIRTRYGEFNQARDRFFDRWGLTDYPASTGIGAALPPGTHISAMFEAVSDGDQRPARPFDTELQCPPVAYGPRFVRANTADYNGCRTVHISGISSIDENGHSVESTDLAVLVDHTMRSFDDLLKRGNMTYDDVCGSYVYCKNAAVFDAFKRYAGAVGLSFPYLVNHVDVCRPELVFEIEARAIKVLPG